MDTIPRPIEGCFWHRVSFWVAEKEHMRCCHQSNFSFVTKVFYQCPASQKPDLSHSNPARVPKPSYIIYSLLFKWQDVNSHIHKGCQATKQRVISILTLQVLTATFTIMWYQNKHLSYNSEDSKTKVNERTCYISSVQNSGFFHTSAAMDQITCHRMNFKNIRKLWKMLTSHSNTNSSV